MNNLTGMLVFAQVVQAGSFSKAAEALGMSKSSVSKKVTFLEDRLGVRLLNRTTRKLSLTEVGHVFFERCERIMAEAEEAELAITRLQDEPRGQLKISAPVSFGIRHLGMPLAQFAAQYDELGVELSLNDRFVDIVEEGYDMSIRIGRLPDSSLIARKIGTSRMVTSASASYLEKYGTPRHPTDLEHHRCITYSLSRNLGQWNFRENDKDFMVKPKSMIRTNNGDIELDMAAGGAGILHIPAFICGHRLKSGDLIPILSEFEEEPINIYAVYPHNRHLSAKVRLFVDFLKDWFEKGPDWDKFD